MEAPATAAAVSLVRRPRGESLAPSPPHPCFTPACLPPTPASPLPPPAHPAPPIQSGSRRRPAHPLQRRTGGEAARHARRRAGGVLQRGTVLLLYCPRGGSAVREGARLSRAEADRLPGTYKCCCFCLLPCALTDASLLLLLLPLLAASAERGAVCAGQDCDGGVQGGAAHLLLHRRGGRGACGVWCVVGGCWEQWASVLLELWTGVCRCRCRAVAPLHSRPPRPALLCLCHRRRRYGAGRSARAPRRRRQRARSTQTLSAASSAPKSWRLQT